MIHFKREEFACRCGCGFDTVDYELVDILDDVREFFNSPLIINSGNRCHSHNHSIGGSEHSQHLVGKAADIVVSGFNENDVYQYLNETYNNKYGIGLYNGRVHIDVRSGNRARWNKKDK